MYKILHDGEVIAIVDDVRYVRKKASTGCWIQAHDEDDAEAIALNGDIYSIEGKTLVPETSVALVKYVDGGQYISQNYATTGSVAAVEEAICLMDVGYCEEIEQLETALCEIDAGNA